MQCTNTDQLGLKKPSFTEGIDYRLDLDGPTIKALGYGTTNKDRSLSLMEFDRRAPGPDDVVIEIAFCGVCHSDWHVILNEWKNTKYPTIVGHEITGYVVKKGYNVTKFNIGDTVALGPNFNSCRSCNSCREGNEQYCLNDVTETYNMPERLPNEYPAPNEKVLPTGPITYGGYSNIIVADQNFVLSVPKGAPLDRVAPILCAGITMYTPLKSLGINSSHRVGIAGIGGLGHIGVKLAKSMGAQVVGLTHTPAKLDNDLNMDKVLLVQDLDTLREYNCTFDLIICTAPFNHDMTPYIELMKPNGVVWIVGSMFPMTVDFDLINRKGRIVRGSSTGNIADTQELIDYCVTNNIYPDIELIDIKNINETHRPIIMSEVRYRYVATGFDKM